MRSYRLSDFPGANFNLDQSSAGFRSPMRVYNIDFVAGTGITARPAFRTHVTAAGSYWYTWCESVFPANYVSAGNSNQYANPVPAYLDTEAFAAPIIIRTPQSGSTNLWAVSPLDGTTVGSMTLGGGGTDSTMVQHQYHGGLSISGTGAAAAGVLITTPQGNIASGTYGATTFTFSAVTSPATGSYGSNATHCAVLHQSRRYLVGQSNRVWFTDPDSTTFSSNNYFSLPGSTYNIYSSITGMTETNDGVYIVTNNGIFFVYGETTDSNGNALIQYRKISELQCPIHYYGLTKGDDSAIYVLTLSGLYQIRGVSTSRIQMPFDYVYEPSPYAPISNYTTRDTSGTNASGKDLHYFPHMSYSMFTWDGTTYERPATWMGVAAGGRKLFVYGKSPDLNQSAATTLSNVNGGTWVLDLPTNKWSFWDISPNCITFGFQPTGTPANTYRTRAMSKSRIFFASSGAGLTNWSGKTIMRSDTGQVADSPGSFSVEYFTGFDGLGIDGSNKFFHSARIWGQGNSLYPVTVDPYVDYEQLTSRTGTFDVGNFGSRISYKIFPIGTTGGACALRLYRTSSGQNWHIGAIDFFYDDVSKAAGLNTQSQRYSGAY